MDQIERRYTFKAQDASHFTFATTLGFARCLASMNTGLLVIDVQSGMFDGVTIPKVWNDESLLINISSLIEGARCAKAPVFFVQHEGEPSELLARGTPAFEIHPLVAPREHELLVVKRGPNSFHNTALDQRLKEQKIGQLLVCGIQTEVCVDSTCRAAKDLGYQVTLVSDAHSTWSNDVLSAEKIIEHHNTTLRDYYLVELCPTRESQFQ